MIERPLRIFRSIAELQFALRDRTITARSIVEDCIDAHRRWDSRVHAWVSFDAEGALLRADAADRDLRAGRPVGPLHGIPIGVKDIVDVEGYVTQAGAKHWSDAPAAADAPMVARLRAAGAIILGKTVTTPYAWIDPPATRNPWNLDRTPGGSSSGSAAAVASGLAVAAIGTQTGGSIIRPAAFCGVVGWKPAGGSKPSLHGIVPFAHSLDIPGFLTRSVTDIYTLHESTVGPIAPPRSPIASHRRMAECLRRLDDSIDASAGADAIGERLLDSGVAFRTAPRLGRIRGVFESRADPIMNEALDAAADRWSRDGCEIVEVELPEIFERIHVAHRIVMAFEAAQVHGERFARLRDDYPPRMAALVAEGLEIDERYYLDALAIGRRASEFFRPDLDAFVLPAALGPAPGPETTGDPFCNSPWTFDGRPSISVPIGLDPSGLPLAAQLVGRTPAAAEADLLGAAHWCELDPEVWPLDIDREKRS
ncbi:MAG: amidase [Isosphaeraceae bacterium]|nr:amidase [Isosphaeraceae bacterium]